MIECKWDMIPNLIDNYYAVSCYNCEAQGPIKNTRKKAISWWNKDKRNNRRNNT